MIKTKETTKIMLFALLASFEKAMPLSYLDFFSSQDKKRLLDKAFSKSILPSIEDGHKTTPQKLGKVSPISDSKKGSRTNEIYFKFRRPSFLV